MNLYVLDIRFTFLGREMTLYPVVLRNSSQVILVDCGYAGFTPLLEEALNQHGLSLHDLTGVLITHHDLDHMGCLAELKEQYPSIKVYTPEEDKPYVEGSRKSLRLQQAEDIYPCLAEEQKADARSLIERLKSVRPAPVDETFAEEGELPFLKGVWSVHTPGHMPGHISLYLPEQKTLIAADALVYYNGQLSLANPQFTMDLPAALDSVRKLQQLDIETVVCFHGGVVTQHIQEDLRALLERYSKA